MEIAQTGVKEIFELADVAVTQAAAVAKRLEGAAESLAHTGVNIIDLGADEAIKQGESLIKDGLQILHDTSMAIAERIDAVIPGS
jgi:hypothetical protein